MATPTEKQIYLAGSAIISFALISSGALAQATSSTSSISSTPSAASAPATSAAPATSSTSVVRTSAAPGPQAGSYREDPDDFQYTIGGYIRQDLSLNLQNHPELKENTAWTPQMIRTQARLDVTAQKAWIKLVASVRGVGEFMTTYQEELKNPANLPPGYPGANAHDGPNGSLLSHYNGVFLRDAYADIDAIPDRLSFRIGRQQLVWGETDFFVANDLVQGYDYSWRSFLEADNEELRKPLFLVTTNIQVPEAAGMLQVFVRPGLDEWEDIGNTYDLWGGRWANQPNKGYDFLTVLTYNLNHPDGDKNTPSGGIRWTGRSGDLNYSFSFLRTFNPDPVVSPSQMVGTPDMGVTPKGEFGDLIYPFIDVLGTSANYYVQSVDTAFATEISYTFQKPYNYGTNDDVSHLDGLTYGQLGLPGFAGVKKLNTLSIMLRADHELNLQHIFFTEHDSFFSVQLFNTIIPSLRKSDGIVDLVGFGAEKRTYDALVTFILNLNYMHDTLNVGFAGGADVTVGGSFLVPSVSYVLGNHWRLKAEADLFFVSGKYPGEEEDHATLLSYFANNDQFLFRAQYQF